MQLILSLYRIYKNICTRGKNKRNGNKTVNSHIQDKFKKIVLVTFIASLSTRRSLETDTEDTHKVYSLLNDGTDLERKIIYRENLELIIKAHHKIFVMFC